jgi:hypothetical protein
MNSWNYYFHLLEDFHGAMTFKKENKKVTQYVPYIL